VLVERQPRLRWGKGKNSKQIKALFVNEAEVEAEMLLTGLEYLSGLREILNREQVNKLEAQGIFLSHF